MQLTRYNTDLGSPVAGSYTPSVDELAIMAIQTRSGKGPSRWLEARADQMRFTADGALRSWSDRARGIKYVPAGGLVPGVTGAGTHRRVTFSGAAGQAMVAEDASDAFTDPEIYTVAFLTRQTPANNGGAPFGNGAIVPADIMYPWFNPQAGAALTYFSRGEMAAVNSSVAQNDSVSRVNLISVDTTQANPALRSTMRCDGQNLIGSGDSKPPVALASSFGARRMTLGGAGARGATGAFIGSVGAIIVIPGVAVHMQASGEYLSLIEGYLSGLKALV